MRQSSATGSPSLPQGIGASRGVLGLPPAKKPDVSRWPPTHQMAQCIAYYWMVRWDLTGEPPHRQETAPHPNVYLIFDEDRLTVSGVSTRKFTRVLAGKGRAFGVKFRPGGFRPFVRQAVSSLTGRIVPAHDIFGDEAHRLEHQLRSATQDAEVVDAVHSFFLLRIPAPDNSIDTVASLVEQILLDRDIKTVDDLAARTRTGKRTLQRLFQEYVGVPPKWVIRRYRLHDLIDRINSGEKIDWATLAQDLGYFDQSHLINDFKSIVGRPPAQYRRGAK